MHTIWVFTDQESLLVAAGLLPEDIVSAPALMALAEPKPGQAAGQVYLALIEGAISSKQFAKAVKILKDLNVATVATGQETPVLRRVLCWAEGISLVPNELPGEALFVVPTDRLLLLAAEMVRLGCDRQSLRFLPDCGLLRVSAPPIYTIYRAQEEGQVYGPGPREGLWVKFGKTHPWAKNIRIPEKSLLLIGEDMNGHNAWTHLPDGEWEDVESLVDVTLTGDVPRLPAIPSPARIQVPLRFGRSSHNAATLWLPEHMEDIDTLLSELPEEVLDRLEFAVIRPEAVEGEAVAQDRILLRARTSTKGPPELELPGVALCPHPHLPALHLPVGQALEPPLRKARLQERVRLAEDEIGWLLRRPNPAPGTPGLYLERVRLSAFQPLSGWVDYLMDRDARTLTTWMKGIEFDFEQLMVATMAVVKEGGEGEKIAKTRNSGKNVEAKAPPSPAPTAPAPKASPVAAEARQRQILRQDLTPDALTQLLREREKSFLELMLPADAPERISLWEELGGLQSQMRRLREAGLCWVHAAWIDPSPANPQTHPESALQSWAEGEQKISGEPVSLLKSDSPNPDQVRAVAAAVAAGRMVGQDAQSWLDRYDNVLDLRSIWLARLSLARTTRDPLGLARARDRVLGALRNGMPAERNVPVFVRFSAAGAIDLAPQLEVLYKHFRGAKRKKSPTEPPEAQTFAGMDLIFAWGFARLGAVDRARAMTASALGALKMDDPIHAFVAGALSARVGQALQGEPIDAPLPATLRAQLTNLDRFSRYKVDRFRQALRLLEAHEHLDPFRAFAHDEEDPLGPEFAPLRGMADSRALSSALADLLKRGGTSEEQARRCEGVLEFLFLLPPSLVEPHLDSLYKRLELLPPPAQVRAWTQALSVTVVQRLDTRIPAEKLQDVILKNPVEASVLEQAFVSFRRAGLYTEAQVLLEKLGSGANRQDRLVRAGGKLMFGQKEPSEIQDVLVYLKGGSTSTDVPVPERLLLSRGVASALVHAGPERACAAVLELSQQLTLITDTFNTNSHYCLSVLAFTEALILGLVHEELGLGEAGRRWVEEDEHLLRRRIHTDFATLT